ncbi:MFS transporter [Nonomuraea polychroma]|uniref:MFS transporter n=1 Tax=Nonomuraea polychroma TaxID=46176 RepID=UPI003D8F192D
MIDGVALCSACAGPFSGGDRPITDHWSSEFLRSKGRSADMSQPRYGGVPAIMATAIPMFMVALDHLVVTNALTQMIEDFNPTQAQLQWVVNAYVLAFAGLLLAGAALGDRFGRRRVFLSGVLLFTAASAACAMADSIEFLIFARVLQGLGAAAVLPISLTLAVAAVPQAKREMAVGIWGGINGLGIAAGPLVGGLVTEGIDWHWIFWINVPAGLVTLPFTLLTVRESKGRDRTIDLPGTCLITGAVVLSVWTIVNVADLGWTDPGMLLTSGCALLCFALFLWWESRAKEPFVPARLYRVRPFMLSNFVSLTMYFGVFGAVFFLMQYLQGPLGFSPLEAGLRTLPWTAIPMVAVPLTSLLVKRVGGGILQAIGATLQAVALGWLAFVAAVGASYTSMIPALVIAGFGMGMVFAANPAVVVGSVPDHDHGKATGVNNTIREFGGALGVAVLTMVFTNEYATHRIGGPADAAEAFVSALREALWLGAAIVLLGALAALFIRKPAVQLLSVSREERAPVDTTPIG